MNTSNQTTSIPFIKLDYCPNSDWLIYFQDMEVILKNKDDIYMNNLRNDIQKNAPIWSELARK